MSLKDCIEHLYSWDYTSKDSFGCPGCAERDRIIKLLLEFDAQDDDRMLVLELVKEIEK